MSSFISAQEALRANYRFDVIAEEQGGYTIVFPDLPGCMSQVKDASRAGEVAEEIRTLWIETAQDMGLRIPAPTYPEIYSGKFNVRLPKSLHRKLAQRAAEEGVSLNQWVVSLLSERSGPANSHRGDESGISDPNEPGGWQTLGSTPDLISDSDTTVIGHSRQITFLHVPLHREEGTLALRPDNVIPFDSHRRKRRKPQSNDPLAVSV